MWLILTHERKLTCMNDKTVYIVRQWIHWGSSFTLSSPGAWLAGRMVGRTHENTCFDSIFSVTAFGLPFKSPFFFTGALLSTCFLSSSHFFHYFFLPRFPALLQVSIQYDLDPFPPVNSSLQSCADSCLNEGWYLFFFRHWSRRGKKLITHENVSYLPITFCSFFCDLNKHMQSRWRTEAHSYMHPHRQPCKRAHAPITPTTQAVKPNISKKCSSEGN